MYNTYTDTVISGAWLGTILALTLYIYIYIVISGAWLGTILASISVLPKEEVKHRILTVAVSKGQLSQTVTSRKASCCILGKMALRFDSMW